jgi:hypothetical protein
MINISNYAGKKSHYRAPNTSGAVIFRRSYKNKKEVPLKGRPGPSSVTY